MRVVWVGVCENKSQEGGDLPLGEAEGRGANGKEGEAELKASTGLCLAVDKGVIALCVCVLCVREGVGECNRANDRRQGQGSGERRD